MRDVPKLKLNHLDTLESYFDTFRDNIIGADTEFETPYGRKRIVYADWTASGRLYAPIEKMMAEEFGPFVANTHSETNVTGTSMTLAYNKSKNIIRKHVNADENDVVICTGSGMTGPILKMQRMLGYKVPSPITEYVNVPDSLKPVVFVTHMEHHSNQTTWLETIAKKVEIINPDSKGQVDLGHFRELLEKHKHERVKIASVLSCSNVTGVFTPYYEIAELIHKYGGWCFVDFAASAPYVNINMHPENPAQKLDAIFFSPHKFLGGPGTTGVMVFDKNLYNPDFAPDQPGGGTVKWTNPWGEHRFYDDIESREDGGTPPFLQVIKTALCIKLKEQLNPDLMMRREEVLRKRIFSRLQPIKNLHVLAGNIKERLLIFSFHIDELHYNLGVKLLNDRFGVQVRGGCSCAGTYGHYLLHVSPEMSKAITNKIDNCDLSEKPGWMRFSIHPVMKDSEVDYILDSVEALADNHKKWGKDYYYDKQNNYFVHKSFTGDEELRVDSWFGR